MTHPRAEDSPGLFLEHYDLASPSPTHSFPELIVYRLPYRAAKEAAATAGWGFRSFSSGDTPGIAEDWIVRDVRSFPMVILFRDGIELGRCVCSPICNADFILSWARTLM